MFALIIGLDDSADKRKIRDITSGRFFENEPSEICSHLRDKGPKGRLFCAISSKITLVKEKERRKRDSEGEERRKTKEKKSNGCTLTIFVLVTLELFWPAKRLLIASFQCHTIQMRSK